jgi:membrane-bound ClpP family serine protease
MGLGLALISIGIGLFTIGILYAVIIYKWPIDRTWVEVLIGVSLTISGEMLALALVLIHYGLLEQMWWIIPFPIAAFACTGLPMMVLQELKIRRQKKAGEQEENKFNGRLG